MQGGPVIGATRAPRLLAAVLLRDESGQDGTGVAREEAGHGAGEIPTAAIASRAEPRAEWASNAGPSTMPVGWLPRCIKDWIAPHTSSALGSRVSVRTRAVPARVERIISTAELSSCSIARTGRLDSMAWNTLEGV